MAHDIALTDILQRRQKIMDAFQFLGEDQQAKLEYLMDLGEALPSLTAAQRSEENKISGCMSKVWLVHREEKGVLILAGDSNTVITKGLLSLLIQLYTHQKPKIIIDHDFSWLQTIGLYQIIGAQRANGFAHMINRCKMVALRYYKQKV